MLSSSSLATISTTQAHEGIPMSLSGCRLGTHLLGKDIKPMAV
jgi:hypothetical protein